MQLDPPLLIDPADVADPIYDPAREVPESLTLVFRTPILLGTEQYAQAELTEPTADETSWVNPPTPR